MPVLYLTLYLFFIFIFSAIVTGLVRRYSLRKSLIDIPNERSSHSQPTPRGGGLSIVLALLISLVIMYYIRWIGLDVLLALGIGGVIVAITGWIDDHYHLSPLVRIFIYLTAAVTALWILGGLPQVSLGIYILSIPLLSNLLTILGMVWFINLYNFMDGTDALAAIQTVCAGLFLGLLFMLSGQTGFAILSFIIVAATTGFLYWNWPPARIFMGDVGSCFNGFFLGILALLGEKTDSVNVIVFIILLGIFICDATCTLIMRIVKKEKWYSAHRSHAYQRLVQMGISHKQLVLGFLAVNMLVLWPAAFIAYQWGRFSIFVLFIIVLLLCVLWAWVQLCFQNHSAVENQ